jgi:hypothetical protein
MFDVQSVYCSGQAESHTKSHELFIVKNQSYWIVTKMKGGDRVNRSRKGACGSRKGECGLRPIGAIGPTPRREIGLGEGGARGIVVRPRLSGSTFTVPS